MDSFDFRDGELFCEDVPVAKIASDVGSPVYIYSGETLQRHFKTLENKLQGIEHLICFAVKANSNIAVLKLLADMGCGMDIVSGGELFRAMKAGVDPKNIVYAGVGKRKDEIREALSKGILQFNVESRQELESINEVAASMGKKAPIALRVNPNIDAKTHPYISTGLKKNKFGVSIEEAISEYCLAKELENIEIVGIHHHIGSQITDIQPFLDAFSIIKELVKKLEQYDIKIKNVDIGGGLGITYDGEIPPSLEEFSKAALTFKDLGCRLILEPGRVIAGNAGVLVSRVLYLKKTETKDFVIVDAAMNDLLRPSLYDSYHKIVPVFSGQEETVKVDVVGPVCETGDFLARDRDLPLVAPGDLLAVMSAGAYGFTMSSNYNSRQRVAEVMVKGKEYEVIRKRETYDDLINGEKFFSI